MTETFCPSVYQRELTLTACGKDLDHPGPHTLGDVEWWDDGRAVRRTVDGDIVGMGYRNPARRTTVARTSAAIIGDQDRETLAAPGQARTDDPDTSHAAAAKWPLRKGSQRTLLLLAFADAGERGATDERAAYVAGVSPQSEYATRCSELKRMGLVVDTTETRPGLAGVDRMVRRITPAGLAQAEALR